MLRTLSSSPRSRCGTASLGPSHHRVFHVFHFQAFLARLLPYFLATAAAFFLIFSLTAKLELSQGFGADASEKGNSLANSSVLTSGVNRSFFLALEVMLGLGGTGGFLPGLEGPPGEALCFIPWAVLTNCVNQACTGPASKSSSPDDVAGAPVARTPLTGAPNGWCTFLVQWRN